MNRTLSAAELLATVFDSAQDGLRDSVSREEYDRRRDEFVFHLMDGKTDLERLADILNHPDGIDEKDATTTLMAILYHIIPHLKAAGRLLLDEVPDAFAE